MVMVETDMNASLLPPLSYLHCSSACLSGFGSSVVEGYQFTDFND